MMRCFLFFACLIACGGTTVPDGGDDGPSEAISNDGPDGDSATDASKDSADTDAAAFEIKNISGLVLWLDGSLGIVQSASRVSTWADQSGNGNHAAQGTAGLQPAYVATGIGGLPCVHFDAASQTGQVLVVPDSMSLQFGIGDFLLEVVARYDNAPTAMPTIERAAGAFYAKANFKSADEEGIFFWGNTAASQPVHTNLQAQVSVAWNLASSNDSYNDATGRVIGLRRTGSILELRASGAAVGSSTYTKMSIDVSAPGIPLNIGATGGQGYPEASLSRLDGDICEVIAVKGSISANDLSGIEKYLAAKYKL